MEQIMTVTCRGIPASSQKQGHFALDRPHHNAHHTKGVTTRLTRGPWSCLCLCLC